MGIFISLFLVHILHGRHMYKAENNYISCLMGEHFIKKYLETTRRMNLHTHVLPIKRTNLVYYYDRSFGSRV